MSAISVFIIAGAAISCTIVIAWWTVRASGRARRQDQGGRRVKADQVDPTRLAREIAHAEADLGIPVATDAAQPCPVCQTPRVVGACYCATCRHEWEPVPPKPHALLCPVCERRIPDDSRVCPFCGTPIQATLRLWNRHETTVPSPMAVSTWRCPLCGTPFRWMPQSEHSPTACQTCGASFNWRPLPSLDGLSVPEGPASGEHHEITKGGKKANGPIMESSRETLGHMLPGRVPAVSDPPSQARRVQHRSWYHGQPLSGDCPHCAYRIHPPSRQCSNCGDAVIWR